MNTMNDDILYCTQEQTQRALRLGFPIKIQCNSNESLLLHQTPTADYMLGVFKKLHIDFDFKETCVFTSHVYIVMKVFQKCTKIIRSGTRNGAVLAAIDAALDYLEKLNHK